jgi:hypothetical protein
MKYLAFSEGSTVGTPEALATSNTHFHGGIVLK